MFTAMIFQVALKAQISQDEQILASQNQHRYIPTATGYALSDWGSIPGRNKDFLYDIAPTQTLRYKNECHCLTSRCLHDTVFNYMEIYL